MWFFNLISEQAFFYLMPNANKPATAKKEQ
jgi:hypothetical protein